MVVVRGHDVERKAIMWPLERDIAGVCAERQDQRVEWGCSGSSGIQLDAAWISCGKVEPAVVSGRRELTRRIEGEVRQVRNRVSGAQRADLKHRANSTNHCAQADPCRGLDRIE